MLSKSLHRYFNIVSAVGGAVVIAVVDQHRSLPAVRTARHQRLVAAGENTQRVITATCRVQNLSQNLGLSSNWEHMQESYFSSRHTWIKRTILFYGGIKTRRVQGVVT